MNLTFAPIAAMMITAASLGGCTAVSPAPQAGTAPPAAAERIAWSVGPCFGFCPVYSAAIAPDGAVSFDGQRHTAMLGRQSAQKTAGEYRRLAAALAPYRPAGGTQARTSCDVEASDMADYHISWTAPDGTQTVLDHNLGCRSPRNDALNAVLKAAPAMLGIAPWVAQTTRPGVSRG